MVSYTFTVSALLGIFCPLIRLLLLWNRGAAGRICHMQTCTWRGKRAGSLVVSCPADGPDVLRKNFHFSDRKIIEEKNLPISKQRRRR